MHLDIGEEIFSQDMSCLVAEILDVLEKIPEIQREKVAGKIVDVLIGERKNHNTLAPSVGYSQKSLSGIGIFALEKINAGQQVALFGGNVTHISDWIMLDEEVRIGHVMVSSDFTIGSTDLRDIDDGDFINHSCEPNCGIQGHIKLVAMRDILPGEEITFDYGTVVGGINLHNFTPEALGALRESDYINGENIIIIPECQCGSEKCRGIITANDWIQLQRDGFPLDFFSHHIRNLIANRYE